MTRTISVLLTALAILIPAHNVAAQQSGKVYRIGYLQGSPNMDSKNVRAFRRGLRDLGYVEGRNITIEWRHTNGRRDTFAGKVDELVRLGVDCIVTVGVAATRAAKEVTNTIPIVMADADGDPVQYGLIASYARPGGNVTGIVSFASQLSGKRLELLQETVPGLSRVAALVKARAEGAAAHIPQIAKAARALGVAFHPLKVQVDEGVIKAFRDAVKWKADALLVVTVGGMRGHRLRPGYPVVAGTQPFPARGQPSPRPSQGRNPQSDSLVHHPPADRWRPQGPGDR